MGHASILRYESTAVEEDDKICYKELQSTLMDY